MKFIIVVDKPAQRRKFAVGPFQDRLQAEKYAKLKGHKKYEIVFFASPSYR